MAPYCLHFNSKNDFNRFLCDIHPYIEILFSLVYIADVLIEICYSCPVSGEIPLKTFVLPNFKLCILNA